MNWKELCGGDLTPDGKEFLRCPGCGIECRPGIDNFCCHCGGALTAHYPIRMSHELADTLVDCCQDKTILEWATEQIIPDAQALATLQTWLRCATDPDDTIFPPLSYELPPETEIDVLTKWYGILSNLWMTES